MPRIIKLDTIQSLNGSEVCNFSSAGTINTVNVNSLLLNNIFKLPTWTTGTRPATNISIGYTGFNTQTNNIDVYVGGTSPWVSIAGTIPKTILANGSNIEFSSIGSSYNFTTPGTYSVTTSQSLTFQFYLWGAGGGGTQRSSGITGGGGGYTRGIFTLNPGTTYQFVVGGPGGGGATGTAGTPGGGGRSGLPAAGAGNTADGAGGGGFSGIFTSSVSFANSIMIAGGGGGASGDTAFGGGGGGSTGGNASNATGRGGAGGSQSSGGVGGGPGVAQSGSALQGGNGSWNTYPGAGGGGGYYGGGGGTEVGPGAGGGGSGYVSPSVTSGSTFTGGSPGDAANPDSNRPTGAIIPYGSGGANGFAGGDGCITLVLR
jgi:hypothetical protein